MVCKYDMKIITSHRFCMHAPAANTLSGGGGGTAHARPEDVRAGGPGGTWRARGGDIGRRRARLCGIRRTPGLGLRT